MVTTSRRVEVVRLRETGLTYAEIGRRLGITRERVRQILNEKPRRQKPVDQVITGGLMMGAKIIQQPRVMLSTRDVARLLGVHPGTVRRWSNTGTLKSYRIGSRGDRRFRREVIDSFLTEGESTKGGEK